jgi:hypothetical protein
MILPWETAHQIALMLKVRVALLACAPPVIVAPFGETDIERSYKAETRLT